MKPGSPELQSAGALFLEMSGPQDKNPLIAGIVGGTPDKVKGSDPLGYVQDVVTSWRTGDAFGSPSTDTAGNPAITSSPWYARAGVIVLAVVLIAVGVVVIVTAGKGAVS